MIMGPVLGYAVMFLCSGMKVMSMNGDGHLSRGRPKKRWMNSVNDDMRIKEVSMEITSNKRNARRKHVVPTDPT
jgi:hypothetical protein